MRKTTTTTILTLLLASLSFVILIGAASGLFTSPESLQTQIVQGIFGILMLIGGFFYGSSNRNNQQDNNNSNNQNNNKMNQVFWNITDFSDSVLKVDGVPFSGNVDSLVATGLFFYEKDTDNKTVLMTSGTNVKLEFATYQDTSVSCDFIGGRPVRK